MKIVKTDQTYVEELAAMNKRFIEDERHSNPSASAIRQSSYLYPPAQRRACGAMRKVLSYASFPGKTEGNLALVDSQ